MSHRLVSALLIITIILSGLIITDSSEAQDGCPHAPTQLAVGQRAVTNDPLNVRSAPGANNTKIGQITLNKLVEIIGGPVCEGGWRWWQVTGPNMENNTQVSGWVVEVGQGNVYLLLPEGTPLGAHNRWDGLGTIPPSNDQPLMEVVPGIFQGQEDSIRPIATTGVCQNYPYVGMKFLWNNFGMPMIGVRVWPTAQAALMDIDAGWITVNGQNIEMAGLIDGLGWLYPEVILHVEATHFYLIHAGPVCDDDQCAWEISLPDGTTGWVVWRDDFCEWRYGSPLWQIGDVLIVDASPFREIPIFYGDPVPETPTGSLPNGTSVRIIGEGINMPEWYAPWVGAFSIIAYGPEDLGYRWWPVQLEDGTQGYVPEGLPFVKPWLVQPEIPTRFIGADEPFGHIYAYVPAVIHPDSLRVYHPLDTTRVVGSISLAKYFEVLDTRGKWTLIVTPDGQQGQVPTWILQIGTVVADLNVDEIINGPDVAATIYSYDEVPLSNQPARDYLVDQLGRDAGNAINYGYFIHEVMLGTADRLSIVCTPLDVIADYSNIENLERLDVACTVIDIGTGVVTALRGGTPIGLYITGSEIVLENLGPFIRWNDRVWMNDMNQYFSDCPLTRLFWGEEAASYCGGFMR